MKHNVTGVGQRLRSLRINKGITQEHLAEAIGTNRSYIARIENGGQKPSLKFLQKISDHFEVPLPWLLDGIEIVTPLITSFPNSQISNKVELKANIGKILRLAKTTEYPFGYGALNSSYARLKLQEDSLLSGSNLQKIALDDALWMIAGYPDGWEIEIMRAYYDNFGDREQDQWLDFLQSIRWFRECLELSE